MHLRAQFSLGNIFSCKNWEAVAVSQDLKKLPVVIRGVVRSNDAPPQSHYGVENYFVPQFEGKEIEREISDVTVEVSVAKSDESVIKMAKTRDSFVKFLCDSSVIFRFCSLLTGESKNGHS